MSTICALIGVAVMGVQWGYATVDNGLIEYTIQLRAEEARHLAASGVVILSYIPEEARPVGRVRIVVGEGLLPRGPHLTEMQLRTTRTEDRGTDVAGRLVAVIPDPASGVTPPDGGLKLSTPDGLAVGAGDSSQVNNGGSPGDAPPEAAAPGLPLPREGVTQPVHTVGSANENGANVPPLGQDDVDTQRNAAAGDSPSDSLAAVQPIHREDGSLESDQAKDRPWLPLVAVGAVACGFLAGNVFQWRTYVSLRKRYLQLLRKAA